MRAVVAVLVACAGCDQVWGLTRTDDAGIVADGVDDGSASSSLCATRGASVVHCFDFDGTTFEGFDRGTSYQPTPLTVNVLADRRAPAVSAPRALWFDASDQGMGTLTSRTDETPVSRLHATFSIQAQGTSGLPTRSTIFLLSIQLGDDAHIATLELDVNSRALAATFNAQGTSGSIPAGTLPTGWVSVELDLDLHAGQFLVQLPNVAPVVLQIGSVPGAGGSSTVQLGPQAAQTGDSIGFDNVVVTAP